MVKKLIIIYGCHGSGKTTLAKNIVGEEAKEIKTNNGIITVSRDNKVVALGKYTVKTGGCDGLRRVDNYFVVLREAIDKIQTADLFVMEGILLSSVINKPLKILLQLKHEFGFDIEMIFLKTSVENSLRRVCGRNGKIPNINNILSKFESVRRVFVKIAQTKEFKCFVINTDNLTSKQVYENFLSVKE